MAFLIRMFLCLAFDEVINCEITGK